MGRYLELGNAANWATAYYTKSFAVQITATRFARMPDIIAPITFTNHVFAVLVEADNPGEWEFGGWIAQKFNTGVLVGGGYDTRASNIRSLSYGEINLVQFPVTNAEFALSYRTPKWFKNVTLTIWEYIGPDLDTTEQLIEELKTKIDAIAPTT